jgi:formamidopyrimidine-DNA glycosylase
LVYSHTLYKEGFTYRLIPFKPIPLTRSAEQNQHLVMYDNMMNKFKFGNFKTARILIMNLHHVLPGNGNHFFELSQNLIQEGHVCKINITTMPELPDLQAFARNLDKKLAGKTIKDIIVHNAKKLNVSEKELQAKLEKQKLKEIYRDGKELHIKFSDGDILALHLMLHGKLFLFEEKNDNKYSIIELVFTDGTGLVLTDFQGIATPTLNPEEKEAPDAVDDKAGFEYLKAKLGKTKTNVKTVLLDQKIIRGIGNAYADEILWGAGISPFSASNKTAGR